MCKCENVQMNSARIAACGRCSEIKFENVRMGIERNGKIVQQKVRFIKRN